MRWSDRQPLKRDEGMATDQGMTLNTQPWRHNIFNGREFILPETAGNIECKVIYQSVLDTCLLVVFLAGHVIHHFDPD